MEKLFVAQPVTDINFTVASFFATLKIELTVKIPALGFLKDHKAYILKSILYFKTPVK